MNPGYFWPAAIGATRRPNPAKMPRPGTNYLRLLSGHFLYGRPEGSTYIELDKYNLQVYTWIMKITETTNKDGRMLILTDQDWTVATILQREFGPYAAARYARRLSYVPGGALSASYGRIAEYLEHAIASMQDTDAARRHYRGMLDCL